MSRDICATSARHIQHGPGVDPWYPATMESQPQTTPGNPESPKRLLLDVAAVAQLLSVSPRTVWRIRERGSLPARKVEGCVRFHVDDVRKYADGLEAR